MEPMLFYLLKVNITLAIMVTMFYIFFRQQKFLQLNRFLLLSIGVISFTLPFYPAITYLSFSVDSTGFFPVPLLYPESNFIGPVVIHHRSLSSYTIAGLFTGTYLLVSVIFFLRLLLQVAKTIRIIQRTDKRRLDGLIYCSSAIEGPFSFFNYIVIPRNLAVAQVDQVILHERAHAKNWHGIDVLFSELISVVLWINPFVHLLKKLVRNNLEFLADDNVLATGIDRKIYQLELLGHVLKTRPIAVNTFFSSAVKIRISMMNTERPPGIKVSRYIFIIPVLFVIYFLLNPPKASSVTIMTDLPKIGSGTLLATSDREEKQEAKPTMVIKERNNFSRDKTRSINHPEQAASSIYIDAKTDTVKIRLMPSEAGNTKRFEGIYLIDGKEYSDDEMRTLIAVNGPLEIPLPARPALTYYSSNDEYAIQQWGMKANKGVILIQPPAASINP